MSKVPPWLPAYARTVMRWLLVLVVLLVVLRGLAELLPLASHLYTVF